MKAILIATKDRTAVEAIRTYFSTSYRVTHVEDRRACLDALEKKHCEFLFIDIDFVLSEGDGDDFRTGLRPFLQGFVELEIIVLTRQELIRKAVGVVRAGASDYLMYPIDPVEVRHVVETIRKDIRLYSELKFLRSRMWGPESIGSLKTESPAMKAVFEKIRAVAPTDTTVLITGETGVGKGVIANLIHRHSRRSDKQYIPVHCGAIPDTLLESELFGHERGAFTGAVRKKLGKFEIAQGGTLFLDEIGTVSASMQIKLLQILQDRTFQRVGGEVMLRADVRILLATNSDLKAMVDEGTFRRDLYYRLHVFPIDIPPLRERREDIPALVRTFVERLNKFSLKQIKDVEPEVLRMLQAYEWPGNIRELENLMERAHVLEPSSVLSKDSFPKEFFESTIPEITGLIGTDSTLEEVRRRAVDTAERKYIDILLQKYAGKINRTAEAAGIGVRQLHKLMTKYNLHKEEYRSSQ